jgi:hypothetical protein
VKATIPTPFFEKEKLCIVKIIGTFKQLKKFKHLKAALRGKRLVDECKSSDVFVNNFCMLLKFPNFLVQMAHSKYYQP